MGAVLGTTAGGSDLRAGDAERNEQVDQIEHVDRPVAVRRPARRQPRRSWSTGRDAQVNGLAHQSAHQERPILSRESGVMRAGTDKPCEPSELGLTGSG